MSRLNSILFSFSEIRFSTESDSGFSGWETAWVAKKPATKLANSVVAWSRIFMSFH